MFICFLIQYFSVIGIMKIEFDDPLFEELTERALAHAVYGGADFGECTTTAERITSGDRDSWYREWNATPTE